MQYVVRVEQWAAASPAAAWRVLTDLEAWPRWDPYIEDLHALDGWPLWWAPGRRLEERVRRGPFRPRFVLTVTGIRSERQATWTGRYFGVAAHHRWWVEPAEDGVRLGSEETFRGPAMLVGPMRLLFALFGVRRMARDSLGAWARQAEAEDADRP